MQQLMRVAPSMADVMLQALWRMIISAQGIPIAAIIGMTRLISETSL